MTHPVITATLRDIASAPHPADSFWTRRDYVPPPALRTPAEVVRRPLPRADLKPQARDRPAVAPLTPGANGGVSAAALATLAAVSRGARVPSARERAVAAQRVPGGRKAPLPGTLAAQLVDWVAAQPGPVTQAQARAAVPQVRETLAHHVRSGYLSRRRYYVPGAAGQWRLWVQYSIPGRAWPPLPLRAVLQEPGQPAPAGAPT